MDATARFSRKMRLYEAYSAFIWPLHRLFIRRHLSKRCRICQISEKCLSLSQDGVCSLCRQASTPIKGQQDHGVSAELEKEFDQFMKSYAGKGGWKYDALFLLSGGKDSAYLLHRLVETFKGLRLLAVTYDNGFLPPVAMSNAIAVAKKEGVDHIVLRPEPSFFRKTFKFACTHYQKGKGSFEIVDGIDGKFAYDVSKHLAARFQIPLVIIGFTWIQVDRIFSCQQFVVSEDISTPKTQKYLDPELLKLYDSDERKYWWDPKLYPKEAHPEFVFPFFVWRLEEPFLRNEVARLGLIEKGKDSPLVTNPTSVLAMIFADYPALGYASFEPEFARLVREGKASRFFVRNVFEIMEYSARTGFLIKDELKGVLAAMDLKPGDVGLHFRGEQP